MTVCELARRAGIDDFDVEIWNELTFGTRFLDINNYYDQGNPKAASGPDTLNRGGRCWELARRTIEAVKRQYPKARLIWGFSNTTFFHCPIAGLPPGTDGQSYHPYGTGTRSLPRQEYRRDHPELNLEGFTPTIDIRMPEGWAHTFLQTESVMRHLIPMRDGSSVRRAWSVSITTLRSTAWSPPNAASKMPGRAGISRRSALPARYAYG